MLHRSGPSSRRLGARRDPLASRTASKGTYVIEVFPALALASIVPEVSARRRAAKYNLASRTCQPSDWKLVCVGAARFAQRLGTAPIAEWLTAAAEESHVTKAHQDRLDSVLCLLIALHWRSGPPEESLVIGDLDTRYIVTPAIPPIREILEASTAKRRIPIDSPRTATSTCSPRSNAERLLTSLDAFDARAAHRIQDLGPSETRGTKYIVVIDHEGMIR